jgi:rubrerythrin
METTYWTECEICDNVTKVTVIEGDDAPTVCPMCGESTDFEEIDDE